MNESLTLRYWSATLGKSLPNLTGQSEPVWAQPHFSHRFTSLPPVEVYELNGYYGEEYVDMRETPPPATEERRVFTKPLEKNDGEKETDPA